MTRNEHLPAAVEAVVEAKRQGRFVHTEDVWSTTVVVDIDAPHLSIQELFAARDAIVAFVHHVDEVFSTFKPHSLVSQVRDGRLSEDDVDAMAAAGNRGAAELTQVIRLCRKALIATRGAFDPWGVEGGFDPSGLVKGWAAGVALDILRSHDVHRAFVNCGGDVATMSDGEPWSTGITDPDDTSKIVRTLELRTFAIATSGTYERGDHVIDPHAFADAGVALDGGAHDVGAVTTEPAVRRVPVPAKGARSATVVGPDPALADAFATALCVDGAGSIEWFRELGDEWSLYIVPVEGRDDRGRRLAYRFGNAFA